MKKFVLTALLMGIGSVAASAADMAPRYAKAAPPVEAVYNWTGFYIGVNGGGGYTTANVDDKDCYNCDSTHTSGFVGVIGGQAGYNWQIRSFVFGVEADGDWASYNQKFVLCNNCGGTINGVAVESLANNATKLDAIVSLRGRAGLAFENTLFYVTGGAAYAQMKNNYQYLNRNLTTVEDSFIENSWHEGFVAGAGVETKWDKNWSFRAEWLHYQFKTKFVNSTSGTINTQCCQFGFGAQTDVFRLGVNYNLMPAAIAARY